MSDANEQNFKPQMLSTKLPNCADCRGFFNMFLILGDQSMFWQTGWLDDMGKLAGEWK